MSDRNVNYNGPMFVLRSEYRTVIKARDAHIAELETQLAEAQAVQAEKDAQIAERMFAGSDGTALERAWIGGCLATARKIREHALAEYRKKATS